MEFDVHDDALSVSAQFLTENRDEALSLLRLALNEPRFDQAAIDRVRGQVLSIIDADAKDPDSIAGATFDRLVFGDHPYGSDLNGTTDSVTGLTRDDVVAAKDRVITRERIFVSAVGDITAEELGDMLDYLFGDLPETGATLPSRATYSLEGGLTVVPYDTPQSVVIFGQRGIARDDEDFFAGYLMMQVLGGGGFNSRLMEEVREKRGLTYGIGAFLFPRDLSHLIQGNVSSDNSKVAEAIDVIKAEWARVAEEGLNSEEVNRVKTYLTGAYPLRFDGNGRIARILVGMQMEDLGLDYVNTRNAKVDAVTEADIDAIIERLIDPEGLHFVVVGKPVGLTASN
jgi:zinc protease